MPFFAKSKCNERDEFWQIVEPIMKWDPPPIRLIYSGKREWLFYNTELCTPMLEELARAGLCWKAVNGKNTFEIEYTGKFLTQQELKKIEHKVFDYCSYTHLKPSRIYVEDSIGLDLPFCGVYPSKIIHGEISGKNIAALVAFPRAVEKLGERYKAKNLDIVF
ncbi:MAG: hypothetical protein QXK37_00265 [Candidatus Woesearchaeota archaeon]